jgi:hypothetical protein
VSASGADHVQDTGRNIGLLGRNLRDQCSGQRRVRGRLQNDCIARCQRVADLPDVGHERGVPRCDSADHTVRFVSHAPITVQNLECVRRVVGLPGETADQLDEEAHVLDHRVDVSGRIALSYSGLIRLQVTCGGGFLAQCVLQLAEAVLSECVVCAPRRLVGRPPCGSDRGCHILGRGIGCSSDHGFIRGADDLEAVPRGGLAEPAVDEQAALVPVGPSRQGSLRN